MKYLKIFADAQSGDGYAANTPFVAKIQGDTPKYLYCGKELGGEVTLSCNDGVLDALRYTLQQLQLPMDQLYILKYEDKNLEPLDEDKYESIYVNHLLDTCGETDADSGNPDATCAHTKLNLVPSNFAPYGAKYLGVYDDLGNRITGLRLSNTSLYRTFGERSYRVGLFSDVHYNDVGGEGYDMVDDGLMGDENQEIENALQFFEEKEEIQFICCAGDVTTNDIVHAQNFREITDGYAPTTPVYACKGNHDNAASYGQNDLWLQYTIPSAPVSDITYFKTGDKTSFYFTKDDSGTTDVYIFFNVNYQSGSSTSSGRCYLTEDIEALHAILNQYRNDRCFVFTHMFFPQKAGTPCDDYTTGGNSHSANYYLHARDFAYLNELNNYYVNSVWFSGHSHYQWKWQQDSDRANVCNWDCFNGDYMYDALYDSDGAIKNTSEIYAGSYMKSAWNVHIPSTCRPLRLGKYYGEYSIAKIYQDGTTNVIGSGSEGGIMDVYKDYVDIRGVVFRNEQDKSQEFTNKYSFLANYRLDVGGASNAELESKDFQYFRDIVNARYTKIDESLSEANNILVDSTKTNADAPYQNAAAHGESPEDTVDFTFTNNGQRFLISSYPTTYITIDSLAVWWNGYDVTEGFTSFNAELGCPYTEDVLGFYGADEKYHTSGSLQGKVMTTDSGSGVEFTISASKITQWPTAKMGGTEYDTQIEVSSDHPLTVVVKARFYVNEDND